MNTLTDLRRTLDRHADDVADPAAVARNVAVHGRIAAVRRRRRAGGVGAFTLVLVAGVAAVAWPTGTHDATPAAPVVLGQKAPTTFDSLGYTYRTDGHGESFRDHGSIRVTASDAPQLFSWTADRPTMVRLVLPDQRVWHSSTVRFGDFVVVPPGEGGTLRISAAGARVGIASYDLTDNAPSGYTRDGVTYRSQVAGARLLAARIPTAGTTGLRTTYVAPGGRVGLAVFCAGLPKDDVVNVSFDGGGRQSTTADVCNEEHVFDPGTDGRTWFNTARAGRSVAVRVWVSSGFHDATPLGSGAQPGLHLGVGVYGPLPETRLGGYSVASVLENDGHTWDLASKRSTQTGGLPLYVPPEPDDRLVQAAFDTHGTTRLYAKAGHSNQGGSFVSGQGSMGGIWAPAGAPVTVTVRRGTGTFGVATYQRAD